MVQEFTIDEVDREALRDVWLMFRREHDGSSVDRMLCDPELRQEFLEAARAATGIADEQTLLWSLISLRKRKTLPRVER